MDVPGRLPSPPPAPYCRWCDLPIHRVPGGPMAGWIHSGSMRVPCRDLEHDAEPRETGKRDG